MSLKNTFLFVRRLILHLQENEVTARGAQLSYYLVLSIFPFLIFLLALLEYIPLTQGDTIRHLSLLLPDSAFTIVEQIVSEISGANHATLLSLGIIGAVWSASRGTLAVIKSINNAYNFIEDRSFLHLNAIAAGFVFALALMILFTLTLLIFGRVIGELAFLKLGMEHVFYFMWVYLRYLVPVILIFVAHCFLYKYSPNAPLCLSSVYPGAAFATVGWILVSQVFAYYVNNFGHFSRTYGSIGGIIVFLIWFYLGSNVILIGGEINAAMYHALICSKPKHIHL